jgi:hypothetical protein
MCETLKIHSTMRQVTNPVLDRILLERDELERLRHVCRALTIFEELESTLRDDGIPDRQLRVEALLSDLDAMRSQLPALDQENSNGKRLSLSTPS